MFIAPIAPRPSAMEKARLDENSLNRPEFGQSSASLAQEYVGSGHPYPRPIAKDLRGILRNISRSLILFSGTSAAAKARLDASISPKFGQSSPYLAQEDGCPAVHIVG